MKDLNIDIEILNEYIKLEKIILFGNLEEDASDYDLLIISDDFQNIYPKKRKQIVTQTISSNKKLDLLCYTKKDYDKIEKTNIFLKNILEKGVVLYDREK